MKNETPQEHAREFIKKFESTESKGNKKSGEKIIREFHQTSNLFALPNDFVENSKINWVKKYHGFRFELKTLSYRITNNHEVLDMENYKNYYSDVPPNPPRSMNEENKIKRWVENEGKKIRCNHCDGIGHILCQECRGIGKITCQNCGGIGKITCQECRGIGIIRCQECRGDSVIRCPECRGDGVVRCKECRGDGAIRCQYCRGYGFQEEYDERGQHHQIPCSLCGGSGGVTCSSCDGSGGVTCSSCDGSGGVTCSSCDGSGEGICPSCDGSGQKICSNCTGNGKEICPSCEGAGRNVCSNCEGHGSMMDAEVWEMNTWIDNEDYPLCIDIPKYVVDKLRGNHSYEKEFDNDHLPRIPNNNTEISRCEVKGEGFEVWEINYSYNGDTYYLYKEEGGDFHWNTYPKDWKKIGILIMISAAIVFFILIILLL